MCLEPGREQGSGLGEPRPRHSAVVSPRRGTMERARERLRRPLGFRSWALLPHPPFFSCHVRKSQASSTQDPHSLCGRKFASPSQDVVLRTRCSRGIDEQQSVYFAVRIPEVQQRPCALVFWPYLSKALTPPRETLKNTVSTLGRPRVAVSSSVTLGSRCKPGCTRPCIGLTSRDSVSDRRVRCGSRRGLCCPRAPLGQSTYSPRLVPSR